MNVCSAIPFTAGRRDLVGGAIPANLRQRRAHVPYKVHVTVRMQAPVQCLSDQQSKLVSIDRISEQEIDATVRPAVIPTMMFCGYANT